MSSVGRVPFPSGLTGAHLSPALNAILEKNETAPFGVTRVFRGWCFAGGWWGVASFVLSSNPDQIRPIALDQPLTEAWIHGCNWQQEDRGQFSRERITFSPSELSELNAARITVRLKQLRGLDETMLTAIPTAKPEKLAVFSFGGASYIADEPHEIIRLPNGAYVVATGWRRQDNELRPREVSAAEIRGLAPSTPVGLAFQVA